MAKAAGEDLQSWFRELPYKMRRQLAGDLQTIAGDLAETIRAAAPKGKTNQLAASVRVTRGRNTLQLNVRAGGALTTKTIGDRTYQREIKIGVGEETQGVAKGNQSVTYDYALAIEYGTQHAAAEPFFYSTYRATAPRIEERLAEAVANAIAGVSDK